MLATIKNASTKVKCNKMTKKKNCLEYVLNLIC